MQEDLFFGTKIKDINEDVVFTVSEYVDYVNEILGIEAVMVEGEVSNFRDISGRNFCYFDIKDDKTAAKCFQGFWRSKKVELKNGSKIKVFGFPTLQKNGSLVIDVREIFLVGEGALLEAYKKLKKKLEKEGLFDEEKKKDVSVFPKIVGLLAGKNSSAFHDVTAEITERWKGVTVKFLPVRVQGAQAKNEIIQAIRKFNQEIPVDTLILARGGGSVEDLQAFDSEEVVREIFSSKIPVISAIGHEDHWTLSDFVADVRAKTPTKAAQIAVPDSREIDERLDYFSSRAGMIVKNKIENQKLAMDEFKRNLKSLVLSQLEIQKEKLSNFEKNLELLNPENVLKRGYAVVERKGKRVRKLDQIKVNDIVNVRLQKGKFVSRIEEIEAKN